MIMKKMSTKASNESMFFHRIFFRDIFTPVLCHIRHAFCQFIKAQDRYVQQGHQTCSSFLPIYVSIHYQLY